MRNVAGSMRVCKCVCLLQFTYPIRSFGAGRYIFDDLILITPDKRSSSPVMTSDIKNNRTKSLLGRSGSEIITYLLYPLFFRGGTYAFDMPNEILRWHFAS